MGIKGLTMKSTGLSWYARVETIETKPFHPVRLTSLHISLTKWVWLLTETDHSIDSIVNESIDSKLKGIGNCVGVTRNVNGS